MVAFCEALKEVQCSAAVGLLVECREIEGAYETLAAGVGRP